MSFQPSGQVEDTTFLPPANEKQAQVPSHHRPPTMEAGKSPSEDSAWQEKLERKMAAFQPPKARSQDTTSPYPNQGTAIPKNHAGPLPSSTTMDELLNEKLNRFRRGRRDQDEDFTEMQQKLEQKMAAFQRPPQQEDAAVGDVTPYPQDTVEEGRTDVASNNIASTPPNRNELGWNRVKHDARKNQEDGDAQQVRPGAYPTKGRGAGTIPAWARRPRGAPRGTRRSSRNDPTRRSTPGRLVQNALARVSLRAFSSSAPPTYHRDENPFDVTQENVDPENPQDMKKEETSSQKTRNCTVVVIFIALLVVVAIVLAVVLTTTNNSNNDESPLATPPPSSLSSPSPTTLSPTLPASTPVPTPAPTVLTQYQVQKLMATDATAGDEFGQSIAVSGDTLVVGAPHDDSTGSAHVYVRAGTSSWTFQAKLTPSDGAPNDRFGYSVAIYNNTIVVGAYLDQHEGIKSGSAYVYERDDTAMSWTQQAKLIASDPGADDRFGYAVAIYESTIVVGAYWDDDGGFNSGSAYVFERLNGIWSEQDKLVVRNPSLGDYFGSAVAIHSDTIAVGAYWDDTSAGIDRGSVFVFQRAGTTWSQEARLTASDAARDDWFGVSVAIDSPATIVVGAYRDDDGGNDSGSAYVFQRADGTWSEQAKLTASDAAPNDRFGYSVAIYNDTIVVGAFRDNDGGTDSGSAYVFQLDDSTSTWTQQTKLRGSDGAPNDHFGSSVAISSDAIVVGAYLDDEGGEANSGSAYVFE